MYVMRLCFLTSDMILDLIVPQTCKKCGDPSGLNESRLGVCMSCMLNEFSMMDSVESRILIKERIQSPWVAAGFRLGEGAIKSLIYKFKYAGRSKVAFDLGREVASNWVPPEIEFALVPVPIPWRRKLKRGYNQTEWIAKGMKSIWGAEVFSRALIRSKHTSSLTNAGRWKRADELVGVIKVGPLPPGIPIVLVDDVLTTGTTLRACRDVLENAHFKVIGAAVIALA